MQKKFINMILLLIYSYNLGAQTLGESGLIVNFELSPRGHILVPITYNDKISQQFIFDTGASMTALNKSRIPAGFIDEFELKNVQLNRAHSTVETAYITLNKVELNGIVKENASAVLMDLTGIESGEFEAGGVLGFDFFGSYDTTIDYAKKQLVIFNPGPLSSCSSVSGVPFELVEGTHIKFPLVLGQIKIPAILDTGSSRTGINGLAAEAIFPGATEQLAAAKKAHSNVALPSGHSDAFLGQLGIGTVSVGEQVIAENHPTNVVNLPVFEVFKMNSSPGALVGADILQDRKIMISYSCKKIAIES